MPAVPSSGGFGAAALRDLPTAVGVFQVRSASKVRPDINARDAKLIGAYKLGEPLREKKLP
jgi:hypothetical protein